MQELESLNAIEELTSKLKVANNVIGNSIRFHKHKYHTVRNADIKNTALLPKKHAKERYEHKETNLNSQMISTLTLCELRLLAAS